MDDLFINGNMSFPFSVIFYLLYPFTKKNGKVQPDFQVDGNFKKTVASKC